MTTRAEHWAICRAEALGMKAQPTLPMALDLLHPYYHGIRQRYEVSTAECDACPYYGLNHHRPFTTSPGEVCLTDLWQRHPWEIPPSWSFGPGHQGYCYWPPEHAPCHDMVDMGPTHMIRERLDGAWLVFWRETNGVEHPIREFTDYYSAQKAVRSINDRQYADWQRRTKEEQHEESTTDSTTGGAGAVNCPG